MELFQFISYLRQFNADAVLIGAAVWGLTFLLRRTLLKKMPKKYLTFVPFVLGILLCAAYAAVTGGFSAGAAAIIGRGITCGAIATVIHVVYEQFFRNGKGGSAAAQCVKTLLADSGAIDDAEAEAIAAAVGSDREEALRRIAAIAGEDSAPALYALLEETLRTL